MSTIRYNENKKYSAFSLIELSIVLIIMGLLVAGITGGASLIKTAQLRSIVTETETYRVAFNTYYSQFNSAPPTDTQGVAWDALKTNNIINKTRDTDGGIVSKYRGGKWFIIKFISPIPSNKLVAQYCKLEDFLNLNGLYMSKTHNITEHSLAPNDAKGIDDKIDDGVVNTGYVRGIQGAPSAAADAACSSGTSSSFVTKAYSEANNTGNYSLFIKLDF
jgi:prepilin-type N-terminal cleavage/methylation domain-containing protein